MTGTSSELFVAGCALLVLVLLCRWVFSTGHRPRHRAAAARPIDFGLLQPVCTVRTADDAAMLRLLLRQSQIRATVSETTDGYALLVFPADAGRAKDLVRA